MRHDILDGSALGQFLCSLAQGNPPNRMTVTFEVSGKFTASPPGRGLGELHKIEVAIIGLRQEDGSGERWIFEGYNRTKFFNGPNKVEGYFSTRDRKGWIEFLKR